MHIKRKRTWNWERLAGLVLVVLVALGAFSDWSSNTLTVTTYTRGFFIDAGALTQGPNAPTMVSVASTYRGLGLNANNETVFFDFHVPQAWNGVSDFDMQIHWCNEPGTAIGAGETVIWDCDWQAKAEGEAFGATASSNATTTYTQSGAGTDTENIITSVMLDHDDVTNPLVVGDIVGVECFRDNTADTYGTAEDAILLSIFVTYKSSNIGAN